MGLPKVAVEQAAKHLIQVHSTWWDAVQVSEVMMLAADNIEQERVVKAFTQLILMCGSKPDATDDI